MREIGPNGRNLWRVDDDTADLTRPVRAPRPLAFAAAPKALSVDLDRLALIVIDMQNDFCHAQGRAAHRGGDVAIARAAIEPLRALLAALRPAEVPVVWVNWGNRPDRANLSPAQLHAFKPTADAPGIGDPLPGGGARALEKDSWDSAIVEELAPEASDIFVDKYRISGFWDTPLDSILRHLRVTTLLFAGVNADQCVMCTLQDAHFLGYDCILLSDCTATSSPAYCLQATLYNVERCFGFVASGGDLIAALARN